jgi:hypothetical protein
MDQHGLGLAGIHRGSIEVDPLNGERVPADLREWRATHPSRPGQEGTCSVRPCRSLDAIAVRFDDDHAVSNAGLILAVAQAEGLGLRELFHTHVDLCDQPGVAAVLGRLHHNRALQR